MTDKMQKVEEHVKELKLDNDILKRVMKLFEEEMDKGLGKETNSTADLKMFPTYVRSLPNGSESGNYLALDLGGTNFRVLNINLDCGEVSMKSKIYMIPPEIMVGEGDKLFDHIADCIYKFMADNDLMNIGRKLPLGFTFSFPLKQEGLNKARLSTWTKGFEAAGVVGEDVVRLLHEAIARKGSLDVECVAVINDTVGALMSCAHADNNCYVGLILGTGSNACYMENLDKVELWDEEINNPKQVIINTECGAFGDNGCIDFLRNEFDKEIDQSSLNVGKQKFEKMISGMYMGEIARKYLEKLAERKLLFKGQVSDSLRTRQKFYTKYISEIEADTDGSYKNTRQVLEEIGIDNPSEEDCEICQYVCSLVSSRSAHLASAGVACLINRVNRPQTTVAIDGSLYRFHPKFHDLMTLKISELVNPGLKVQLKLSNDGSGKGAALVAAVAWRLKQVT